MRLEQVADPEDVRVAGYRQLKDPDLRLRHALFVAEGREVVRRLLVAGHFRVRSVLLTPAHLAALGGALERLAPPAVVYVMADAAIRSLVGYPFHRGCLALGERGDLPAVEDLVAPAGPRCLVGLEDLADPSNVGAVFRNAAAFGAAGLVLAPGCVDPLYRKAVRASMGATLTLPFARTARWAVALAAFQAAGYTVVALTPDADALDIAALGTTHPLPSRAVLVLGAEGPGLSPETRAAAPLRVRVPMVSGADSINVATASGIALHRLRPIARGPLEAAP